MLRNGEKLVGIYEKYKNVFFYLQVAALLLTIASIALKLTGVQIATEILAVGFCTLAFLTSFRAMVALQGKVYSDAALYMGQSIFLVGVLFKFQHWPDNFNALYVGGALAVIGVLLKLFLKKEGTHREENK